MSKTRRLWEGLDSVPAKRPGNVKDMARAARFLGSRGSGYLNGQIEGVMVVIFFHFPQLVEIKL